MAWDQLSSYLALSWSTVCVSRPWTAGSAGEKEWVKGFRWVSEFEVCGHQSVEKFVLALRSSSETEPVLFQSALKLWLRDSEAQEWGAWECLWLLGLWHWLRGKCCMSPLTLSDGSGNFWVLLRPFSCYQLEYGSVCLHLDLVVMLRSILQVAGRAFWVCLREEWHILYLSVGHLV